MEDGQPLVDQNIVHHNITGTDLANPRFFLGLKPTVLSPGGLRGFENGSCQRNRDGRLF